MMLHIITLVVLVPASTGIQMEADSLTELSGKSIQHSSLFLITTFRKFVTAMLYKLLEFVTEMLFKPSVITEH
jgi:hypothetical protein